MKIICIGRNYTEHIEELQNERPKEPVVFLKPDSSILLSKHPFVIPEWTNNVHHEVELLVRINKIGKYIAPKFASDYYSEVNLGIDFTARDVQLALKEKGLPWEKAKGFDGATVIGKRWIPKTEFADIQDINFALKSNDSVVQRGNTAKMLWKIDELVSYVSQYFTLKIGDIIFTGTPSGVSQVMPGDRLKGYIEEEEMFSIAVK